ncbi:SDR family NAD(P)-dependent oxidoreductase [Streptomyces sp. NPDC006978]|uniref:SDR family NAD(P)-dependent oxidoreductase n=1 Tax=Streptomyces sp. NPDC006978 TaxID=3364769 RepID=UPI00369F0679
MTDTDKTQDRGKAIAITGASSGIGRATVLALADRGPRTADRGATVVLGARRSESLEQLAAEIRQNGGRAIGVPTPHDEVAVAPAGGPRGLGPRAARLCILRNSGAVAAGRGSRSRPHGGGHGGHWPQGGHVAAGARVTWIRGVPAGGRP